MNESNESNESKKCFKEVFVIVSGPVGNPESS